ncbi:hypothetical protein MATR_28760 [Marivirga tractuosa]|uniref:CUB protein n=1 Tax=Marivirga tractuosa (strain ATCC 23168 / DSM 4126 / NBRC 15989 / NCIMB 1408 / VKM B-1430 / H-43) TaxID=643867 RepID=E4TKZ8_MARTH|nr:T9SS type A sorting domain-containing protein [Marivirga tractuosa]ADR23275.1 CUB protein [Marivirga tractuosa DSM 4126]BDD16051.1 hypothetical protein MATR_28760 [Marivirga tractuosa]
MKHFYSPLKSLLSLFFILFALNVNAADYFWIGGSGTWSDLNHWATSSGGSTVHSSLPGETDNVIFDANSFSGDGQTVTVDGNIIRVNDFIATNVSYNVDFSGESPIPDIEIYGSMDAPANISFELPGVLLDFNSNVDGQTVNIASGLLNTSEDASVRFSGEGSWSIENGLSGHSLFVTQGEIIFGANTFNFKNVYLWYSFDKILNLTDATLNIEKWTMNNSDFVTVIPNNSTINFSDEFQGYGKTYGTVNVTTPTGFGNDIVISGNNTFQNFTVVKGANLLVDANTTQTILGNLTLNGTSSEVITFESSTKGEKFNFDGTGINISGEYVHISESDFLGTATFSLENSLLIGDVNGWEINSVPTPTDNGSFYYSKIFADSLYIDLDPGDGAERIVFMRQGGFPDITTVNDVAYTANQTFGNGELVGQDTYVMYQGSDDLVKIEGLLPGTEYSIAVREVNRTPDNSSIKYYVPSTGFSRSATTADSGNIYLSYNGTATVSGGEQFFDDGGKGFYFPDRENVLTLNAAEAGKAIKLTFNEFETRSYEELRIFDGTDTTANLITSLSGTSLSLPRTVTSTGENMTLKFTSSDFEPYAFDLDGWVAEVELFYAPPTTVSSDIQLIDFTDSSIDFSFTKGDGDGRLIVASTTNNLGSFNPTNNVNYTANTIYGLGQEVSSGVYVIGYGDVSSVAVTGLNAAVDMQIKIVEYKAYGSEIVYGQANYISTLSNKNQAPSSDFYGYRVYKTAFPVVQRDNSALELNRVNMSSPDYYSETELGLLLLVSARELSYEDLSGVLTDDKRVEANSEFGKGDELLPNVYAVSKDKFDTNLAVNGLAAETEFYFYTVYYRENEYGVRYDDKLTYITKASTLPTGSVRIGDGTSQIANKTPLYDHNGLSGYQEDPYNYEVTYYPSGDNDKLSLLMEHVFKLNETELVVYDGENTSAPILEKYPYRGYPENLPHKALEATNAAGAITIKYIKTFSGQDSDVESLGFKGMLIPTKTGQVKGRVSDIKVSNIDYTSATIEWVSTDVSNVLVVLSETDADSFSPIDGLTYQASSSMEETIKDGNYVVYNGSEQQIEVKNLKADTKYDVKVYQYYGTGSTIIYGDESRNLFNTKTLKPTSHASNINIESVGSDRVTITWKKGDGQRRLVVVNSSNYLSLDEDFFYNKKYEVVDGGEYSNLPSDEDIYNRGFRVAYNGTGNSVTITGLSDLRRTYNFRVIEYNEVNDITSYKVPNSDSHFSVLPPKPAHSVNGFEILDVKARTVEFKLDAQSKVFLGVLSNTADVDVPFEPGMMSRLENYRGDQYFDNKRVFWFASDTLRLEGLNTQTDYQLAIYPASLGDLRNIVNYDSENRVVKSFTTSSTVDYYFVDETGYWDDVENWRTTSGGEIQHGKLPDINSSVIIDTNSFTRYDEEEYVYVSLRDRDYSVNSITSKPLKRRVLFSNVDYYSYSFKVATDVELGENCRLQPSYFYFLQIADTNRVNIKPYLQNPYLQFRTPPSSGVTVIEDIPGLSRIEAWDSKIIFTTEGKESVNLVAMYQSELVNPPFFEDVDALRGELSLKKVYGNSGGLNISGQVQVDSIYLTNDLLTISEGDTLSTSFIQRNDSLPIKLQGANGVSYIKSLADTLKINNAIISNNHAVGKSYYLATNSVGLKQTQGWAFESDAFSVPESNFTHLRKKVLKETLEFTLDGQTQFDYHYMTMRKVGDSLLNLNKNLRPTVSNTFDYNLDVEQSVLNGKEKEFYITDLEPDTEYVFRVFDYIEKGDSIVYSVPSEFSIKTLMTDDIIMARDSKEYLVSGNRNVYGENGGGSSHPWVPNYVTLKPQNPGDKVMLTLKHGTPQSSYVDLVVYDGTDTSAPIVFSENLRRGDSVFEKLVQGYIQSESASGALTLKTYNSSGGGYIYDYSTHFLTSVSAGALAEEPLVEPSNLTIDSIKTNSAKISWTKGDGNKTLLAAIKGGYSTPSSLFKDGFTFKANSDFGFGDVFRPNTEGYFIYNGEDDNVILSNLEPNTRYAVLAIGFNQGEGEDPNYMSSDVVSTSFYTMPNPPNQLPQNFSTFDREATQTNFTFQDSEGKGALILIKENGAVDLNSVTDSIKFSTTSGYNVDFSQLDSLEDGSKIYQINNYSNMNYYLEGLKESTEYHFAIYNYQENSGGRAVNENALTGSFRTQDGSYRIDDFSLASNYYMEGDEICMGADIKIHYNYTGINEGDNSALPFISNSFDMSDSTLLDVLSKENGFIIVRLPEELDSGMHYFSMVPELGSDYRIYKDSLNIQPIQEIEIARNNDKLVINDSGNLKWFRNDGLISQANDSILELSREGVYYASKRAANCEYFSNEIYVKARVALNQDTIKSCVDESVEFSFENALGNLNESFNYNALLLDNSGNEQRLEVEAIDLNDNFFSFSLPENLPTDYYSIILKAEGDSIESDTATLYIENMEPAIITLTESGLSSNYEEGNQWFFNGEPINGATSQSISIDRSGVYSVEVATEFCSVASEGIALTSNRRGLSAVGFKAYPNPVRNDFNLKYTGDEYLGLSSVVITDLTGKAIYNGLHDFQKEKKLEIPLDEINDGVYFITVETESYRAQQKLIKR